MKFSNITTSEKSRALLGRLKAKTGLTPNLLARFAICMSIKEKSIPNLSEYDKDGSILEPPVLFGEYEQIYLGLMKNRLKKDGFRESEITESKLNDMIRCHLNRGVISLSSRIDDLSDFYDLVSEERHV